MRSRSGTGSSQVNFTRSAARILGSALALSTLALLLFAPTAEGNPAGGTVTAGSANIVTSGKTLDVDQSTQRAVIDWRSFNIAPSETTKFNQPSSSSVTLNRINDPDPSQILGTLTANGNVILINPNGVFFGPGSQVDVNGLIATTANIKNADFMANRMNFSSPGNPNASVINQGTITARDAGLVGLVAPNVINSGTINTRLGHTDLGSGDTFTLDMYGDGLIEVGVGDAVKKQVIQNSGTINAAGGTIQVTAAAGRKVVDSLVTISGQLNAPTAQQKNGTIIISAAGSNAVANNVAADKGVKTGTSTVLVSGTLDASGYGSGQTGGSIAVTGDNVGILSGAKIDASGSAGGGTLRIGGNFHGKGTTPTALHTVVQNDTAISADAITAGNGGNVTVWADDTTDFAGSIKAKGGALEGNGGYVETSGHQTLSMSGTVDASAPDGQAGTWLLDPNNATISNTVTTNMGGSPNFADTGSPANVNTTDIQTALNGGTSVNVTASGSIAVNNNITENTYNGTESLTLAAATDITLANNVAITASGSSKLNVTLDADTAGAGGAIVMNNSSSIASNGGNIVMGGGATPSTGYAVGDAASADGINISHASVNAGSGTITMNGQGYATAANNNYGIVINAGSVMQTSGTGTIALTGIGGGTGASVNNDGIDVVGTVQSTASGGGGITLIGYGGDNGGTGATNIGTLVGGTVTSVDGNIVIDGNTGISGQAVTNSTGNTNYGVDVVNVSSTGNATITLTGIGGGSGASTSDGGVAIAGTVKSTATGGGGITLIGYGGDNGGSGASNYGVWLAANKVTSVDGNILIDGNTGISGQAVSSASGGSNYGIYGVNPGNGVSSTSNATITLNGIGAGSFGEGLYLAGTQITGANGNISLTGTGASTSTSAGNFGVYLLSAAALTTGSGTIVITGTGGGTGASGSDYGVDIAGAGAEVTSGTGNISITGTGAITPSGGDYGVVISSPAVIQSTGAATISITGIGGGSGASINQAGLSITGTVQSTASGGITIIGYGGGHGGTGHNSATILGGTISSVDGNIVIDGNTGISGQAVTNSTGNTNYGILMNSGSISSTGNATITLNGIGGGSGASATDYGVSITGIGTTITSVNSNISITGTGAATSGNSNLGIYLNAGTISTLGTGTLTVLGTGAGNTNSNSDYGVEVAASGSISTTNGNLSVTGLGGGAGTGVNNFGVYTVGAGSTIETTGTGNVSISALGGNGGSGTNTGTVITATNGIQTTGSGNVTVMTNTLTLNTPNDINSIGNLTIQPGTANTTVGVGTGAGTLSLPNIYFSSGYLAWGAGDTLTIGGSNAGNMDINTTATFANPAVFMTRSTANITLDNTLTSSVASGTSLTLVAGQNGGDFINNVGATAINPGGGRWLVYSTNPASDTINSLSNNFRRFSCTYGGSCPAFPAAGNGFLYTTTPVLTATPAGLASITYGSAAPSLAGYGYTLSGYLGSDGAADSLSGALNGSTTYTPASPVGTYNINYASGSLASALGYGFSYANNASAFTVTPKALTVTANSFGKTYGNTYSFLGNEFTDAGLVNGDTLTGLTLSSPGAAPTATVAGGPYSITGSAATGTGLSNYTITYNGGTLTVNPAALTITANSFGKTYGNTYSFLGNEFTDTGLVNGDTVSGLNLASAGAAGTATVTGGPYTISGSGAAGSGLSNYTITYNNGSLTVNPAALTITANSFGKTYGTTYSFLGSEFTDTGLVNGDTVTGLTLASAGAAGTATVTGSPYAITGSAATGTGLSNYTITYNTGNLTVNPAALTITANSFGKTYGTAYTFAGNEFTDTGLVNGNTVSSVSLASAGAAGTATVTGSPYAISASGAAGSGLSNYTITYNGGTLTVNPAALTITANSFGKTYGTTYTFLGNEFTDAGLVNGNTVSSVNLASAGAAGTATVAGGPYAITGSAAAGTGLSNYTISYVDGNLTVNPAALTITANSFGKTYGTTYSFLGSEFTDTGLLNGDTVSSLTLSSAGAAATAIVAGSPYAISGSGAVGTGLGNYTISYVNGQLTVNPAALTITANSFGKTYGAAYSFLGTEFPAAGLVNGDTVSSVNLASAGAAATATVAGGPYSITGSAATGTGLSNYTITYVNGQLTVNPAALTITANSFGKTYGTTYSFLGSEFTDTGLVNGDTVTGITLSSPGAAGAATVAGGPYTISGSGAVGTGLSNYNITYNNGNLTVNPKALTITANSFGKTYGTTYSFLGSEFTDTGLVNGDTVTGVNLASAGAVVATAPVGPYAITASNAAGTGLSNYTINYVDGFLIVVPLSLPNTVVMTTQTPWTPVCKSPFDSCMTDGAQDAFANGSKDTLDIRISPELAAMLSY